MQKKKDNFFDKIVKKNYNDELELILENKAFDEHAKSLLLSMLYKIETAYKDYEEVKRNIPSKEEYIQDIIKMINDKCNKIDVINQKEQDMKNRTFYIDKKNKAIKCYPIERKLLYAISKISKNDTIVKSKNHLLQKSISDLINVGSNIETVEPLRDFNGYSWTTITREIESIEHNLIYQNLRIIIGYNFLRNWITIKKYDTDYLEILKINLNKYYGKKEAEKFIQLIEKLSIMLEIKFDETEKEKINKEKKIVEKKIIQIQDREKFIINMTKEKRKITAKIRQIDETINNRELLEKEYTKRNNELPLDKKIFSMRILIQIMTKEREKEFEKIDELNKILNPQNFIKYKEELEKKLEYLGLANLENIDYEIQKEIIELQKEFLKCFQKRIQKATTPNEVMNLIYEFRYYSMLPINRETLISEMNPLEKYINKTIKIIIEKAKEQSVLHVFTSKEELDLIIYKYVLSNRIINLKDIDIKITKEKEKLYITIFEDEVLEEKRELINANEITKKELEIKLNKKIRVFN